MDNVKRIINKGIFALTVMIIMSSVSYVGYSYGAENVRYEHVEEGYTEVYTTDIYGNEIRMTDIYGKWSQEVIIHCAQKGYLAGMLHRGYWVYPDQQVDKLDLALFLGRKAGIDYMQYQEEFFNDVRFQDFGIQDQTIRESYNIPDWWKNVTPYYANWAGQEGILEGTGEGNLNQVEYGYDLTREQAATIIDRYIENKTDLYTGLESAGDLTFKDRDKIADWAQEGVARLTALKIMNGDDKGFFNPGQQLNRAEMCQIIFNLEKLEEREGADTL